MSRCALKISTTLKLDENYDGIWSQRAVIHIRHITDQKQYQQKTDKRTF